MYSAYILYNKHYTKFNYFFFTSWPKGQDKIFLEPVNNIVWNFSYFRNRLRALPPPQPEHIRRGPTINRYTNKKAQFYSYKTV